MPAPASTLVTGTKESIAEMVSVPVMKLVLVVLRIVGAVPTPLFLAPPAPVL